MCNVETKEITTTTSKNMNLISLLKIEKKIQIFNKYYI